MVEGTDLVAQLARPVQVVEGVDDLGGVVDAVGLGFVPGRNTGEEVLAGRPPRRSAPGSGRTMPRRRRHRESERSARHDHGHRREDSWDVLHVLISGGSVGGEPIDSSHSPCISISGSSHALRGARPVEPRPRPTPGGKTMPTTSVDLPLAITALYAAALTIISIVLSFSVGSARGKSGISILHGDDQTLAEKIRRHANFTEYVPMIPDSVRDPGAQRRRRDPAALARHRSRGRTDRSSARPARRQHGPPAAPGRRCRNAADHGGRAGRHAVAAVLLIARPT